MWTENHENILREWKAKSFVNLWLNTASAYYYYKIYDMLTYPVIVFTSISSAALFMGTQSEIIKYMVSGISIITSILTVITRQMRPGELYQEYSNTAKHYKSLIRLIDTCLDLPIELRSPPDVFIERVKTEINALSTTQLFPPLHVLRLFENKFGSLEQKMFGEDIVEVLQHDIETRKMVRKIRQES